MRRLLAGLAVAAALGAGEIPQAWRYNAHNCYPEKGQHWDRLDRARQAGLRAVEIDVTWSEQRGRGVISHHKELAGGEPTLEEYFFRPLLPELRRLPAGKPDWLLLIDFKSDDARLVAEVYRLLRRHRKLLTTAGEDLRYGPLTVLLTGDNAAIAAFARLHPPGERYLAIGNREPLGREYRENVAEYFPEAATGFYRVFNFEWKHVEQVYRREEPLSGAERERLEALARAAHEKGYWLRTWTLNGSHFGGQEWVRERWETARLAGVEMIATDEYELVGKLRESATPGRNTGP